MQANVEDQRRSDDRREGADGVSVTNRCFESVPQKSNWEDQVKRRKEVTYVIHSVAPAVSRKKNIPSKFAPPSRTHPDSEREAGLQLVGCPE